MVALVILLSTVTSFNASPIKDADSIFLYAIHADFLRRGMKRLPGQVNEIAAADKFQHGESKGGRLKDDRGPESNGSGICQGPDAQAEHNHEP